MPHGCTFFPITSHFAGAAGALKRVTPTETDQKGAPYRPRNGVRKGPLRTGEFAQNATKRY
jgi:hypothetical protein